MNTLLLFCSIFLVQLLSFNFLSLVPNSPATGRGKREIGLRTFGEIQHALSSQPVPFQLIEVTSSPLAKENR